MKLFSLKPAQPAPAGPVTTLLESQRTQTTNVLTDLCQQARVGEVGPELAGRWQAFQRELGPSQSVEDLLSFSLHKHAVRGLERRQQDKVFRRLGALLPQPFRVGELGSHARPPVLRQQLMGAQEALERAKADLARAHEAGERRTREHEQALGALNDRCRTQADQQAAQQQRIDGLEADVTEAKQRVLDARTQQEEVGRAHQREQNSLQEELDHAREQLKDLEQLIEFERETTRNFVASHLAWPSHPRDASDPRRRRHVSLYGSRPVSMAGELGTMTPNLEGAGD